MRLINILKLFLIINTSAFIHNIFADDKEEYSCSLKIQPIDFGNFNPYDYTATKLSGSINVQCIVMQGKKTINYVLKFSSGNSGDANNRFGLSNKKKLIYNLYVDRALTQVLGDGYNKTNSFSMSYTLNAKDGARNDNFIIYGVLPIQPFAEQGQYYDNIIVTLTY